MSSTAPQLRSRIPRIAEAAVQRARLTVVPRPLTRSRAPRMPFVTLVSVILLAGVVGLLLFNTSMQQASFRATALERQASDLSARQESLELSVQELRDPRRIVRVAQDDLGMVIPVGPAGVLPLGSGKVIGDPQPAPEGNGLPLRMPPAKKPAALDPPSVEVRERNGARDGAPGGERDRGRSRFERER
jgi:hypothetical protein